MKSRPRPSQAALFPSAVLHPAPRPAPKADVDYFALWIDGRVVMVSTDRPLLGALATRAQGRGRRAEVAWHPGLLLR